MRLSAPWQSTWMRLSAPWQLTWVHFKAHLGFVLVNRQPTKKLYSSEVRLKSTKKYAWANFFCWHLGDKKASFGGLKTLLLLNCKVCKLPQRWLYIFFMEAASRFELENRGFADLCLTTWLCRLCSKLSTEKFLERETRFELATSTLARLHSTAELLPLNGIRFLSHGGESVKAKKRNLEFFFTMICLIPAWRCLFLCSGNAWLAFLNSVKKIAAKLL